MDPSELMICEPVKNRWSENMLILNDVWTFDVEEATTSFSNEEEDLERRKEKYEADDL